MFAVTAFLIGAILGLRFKVFILIPVAIVSFAAIAGVGFAYGSSPGFILFVVLLGVTAVQFGYVVGAVLGSFVVTSRTQNDAPAITAVTPRLSRRSEA
jgi:hypothetical protein